MFYPEKVTFVKAKNTVSTVNRSNKSVLKGVRSEFLVKCNSSLRMIVICINNILIIYLLP